MASNDFKITSERAMQLAYEFLEYREHLLKERIIRAKGEDKLDDYYTEVTFKFLDMHELEESWILNYEIVPIKGIMEDGFRTISVHKATGEVVFG